MAMEEGQILSLLPSEFDKWKIKTAKQDESTI